MRARLVPALLVLVAAGCSGGSDTASTPGQRPPRTEATRLMYALTGDDPAAVKHAYRTVLENGDRRFIAVFLELMRAAEVGSLDPASYPATVTALQKLSGRRTGASWPAWVEWYGATSLRPPPGFTGWKGKLLSRLDADLGRFLRDGLPARIRVEEVQWGGVAVDGIPALDNPRLVAAAAARYLKPVEPVFGISIDGDSRAYPLRILDWHEMANDVVGGVPVSLAYCTLCGSGIAYAGRGSDGETYTFGSSGFLFRSNKLMYDRQTRTLWNQFTGRPVLGRLAATELELEQLPLVLTTWADWRSQHPDTRVLDVNTGFDRPYEPGAAYGDYFAGPSTMFPVWQRRDDLPAKARVFGLRIGGVPRAYPLERLVTERVVNDSVGGTPVVLVSARGRIVVNGRSRRAGPVVYDAGAEVRAYRRGDQRFGPGPSPDRVLGADGGVWRVSEDALIGPGGARADRVSGQLAYWFGWYAFFPRTTIYGRD